MTPIHELLHRIQWDPVFGNARFMIGYYDRVENAIIRVPFRLVHLSSGQKFSFDVIGEDGISRMVPFHRVREVWRDSDLIWQRNISPGIDN